MNKDILAGLICAACIVLLALAARFAHAHGYIDSDVTLRAVAMNGLLIAYFGNNIPKKAVPSTCVRQALRVSGWSMVLSGLIYAGLWAFAPIPVAETFGTGAILAGVLLTLGYCLSVSRRARPRA